MTVSRYAFAAVVFVAFSAAWLLRDTLIAQERPASRAAAQWEYKTVSGETAETLGGVDTEKKQHGFSISV